MYLSFSTVSHLVFSLPSMEGQCPYFYFPTPCERENLSDCWICHQKPQSPQDSNGSLVYPLGDFTGVPKLFHSTTLVAQTVKRLPAVWETWVQFLGRDVPLEKQMAIPSSTLAWKIPWTEEPDRLQSIGWQRVGHD